MTEHLPAVASETDRLLATARSLDPGSVGQPSRCPGWSRGHVLTHIARNADGLSNLVTWATTGVRTPMYASQQARAEDIEHGAGRPLEDLVTDVERTARRFAELATELRPEHGEVRLEARAGVVVTGASVPFMRLREVVFHHVDLDAGYGFGDVPGDVLGALLDDAVSRLRDNPDSPGLRIRTDEGDSYAVGDGTAYVTGSRAAVLGWLARGLTDGVSCDTQLPRLPFGG